jgi:hypothetical protein
MRRLIMTRLAEGGHALEGIAAALPSLVLVVPRDQVGADAADGELRDAGGTVRIS